MKSSFPSLLLILSAAFLWLPVARAAGADLPDTPAAAPLPLQQVVAGIVARNKKQTEQLQGYTSQRWYSVTYSGFPKLHAEMRVKVQYTAPDKKIFTVESHSGSKLLVDRILMRLIRTEMDAQRDFRNSTLNDQNYIFSDLRFVKAPDGCSYSLSVEPKHPSPVLYRGRLWINDKDFGVCRMEISPSKNPSFWIRSTNIHQANEQVAGYWLPSVNRTTSQVRLGGVATLQILCSGYRIAGPTAALHAPSAPLRHPECLH
jgi:hypothetical protein